MVRIAAMVASFAVGVQLARGLGVQGYGYYSMALSIITIAGIPSELGMSRLVTREVAASHGQDDFARLFGVLRWADLTLIRISTLMVLGVVIAGIALGAAHLSPIGLALLMGVPVIPLMAIARIRGGGLQGLHHIVWGQVPANLIRPIVLSAFLFIAYLGGAQLGAPLAMALTSLSAFVAALTAHSWLKRQLPQTSPSNLLHNGRQWLLSCIPMAMTDGMRTLQLELSVLLVGTLAASTSAALFKIAAVTAMMAATPLLIIGHVAQPVIARLHAQQDQARLQKSVTAFGTAQVAGVVILSLPLLVIPGTLLELAFGDQYVPAANLLRIMAIGQIINGGFGPNVGLLNMTHHEGRVMRATIAALLVNLAAVPIFVSLWGVAGAAAAFVLSQLIWNTLAWTDAKRYVGIDTSAVLMLLPVLKNLHRAPGTKK